MLYLPCITAASSFARLSFATSIFGVRPPADQMVTEPIWGQRQPCSLISACSSPSPQRPLSPQATEVSPQLGGAARRRVGRAFLTAPLSCAVDMSGDSTTLDAGVITFAGTGSPFHAGTAADPVSPRVCPHTQDTQTPGRSKHAHASDTLSLTHTYTRKR